LEKNEKVATLIKLNYSLAPERLFSVPLASAPGRKARVKLILPPEVAGAAHTTGTYPLLIQV